MREKKNVATEEREVEATPAEAVEADTDRGVPTEHALKRLMQRTVSGRRRVMEAQSKLREMEQEMNRVSPDKRSRFERLRASALDEYRKARSEMVHTRRQLVTSLKLLPGRS